MLMVDLLEIKLIAEPKVIIETCNRIGIANKKDNILYPSCYLYTINNKFYLVHFKQMFILTRENGYNNICDDDIIRRNAIAFCLKNWGLIEVSNEDITPYNKFVYVLPFDQKKDWKICHKFNLKNVDG
jgi:hypothetical protein